MSENHFNLFIKEACASKGESKRMGDYGQGEMSVL